MGNNQEVMKNPSLVRIWSSIRDELAILQDKSQGASYGQLVNPICGFTYSQNTGCAALVFATEHILSGEAKWLTRAKHGLESLATINMVGGIDEPKWNRLGWHYNKGSLFSTGTLLDAVWKAQDVLRIENYRQSSEQLLEYLGTCRLDSGQYSHDSIKKGHKPVAVQNVTAIALYLMEAISPSIKVPEGDSLIKRNHTFRSLIRGQRHDGFWPYGYPSAHQYFSFRYPIVWSVVRHIPIMRRYFIEGSNGSILFGDAVHNCLVLYYLSKSLAIRDPDASCSIPALKNGLNWVRSHLMDNGDGGLRFNFDWEPVPEGFRHANFRDTSTYFLILAMLPILFRLGVVSEEDKLCISNGLLAHVDQCLLQGDDYSTSIKPYEGPDDVLKWMLPRVGEASAWKGALLAEYILNHQEGMKNNIFEKW
jgi:hypothetical protein